MKKSFDTKKIIVFAALVLVTVVSSLITSNFLNAYHMTIINSSLFYFITVAGITLFLGYAGFLCFTGIAYMGLGAYFVGFLTTKHNVNPFLSLLIGIAATALLCYILGRVLLQLNGTFFMFSDMGIMYVLSNIFNYWVEFTGGPNGIYGIPNFEVFGFRFDSVYKWFPFLLILSFIVLRVLIRIKNTTFGRSLMAVRDDPTAALTLGVDVYRTKVYAYTIAGALAALSGGLYAMHNGVISATLFTYNVQLNLVTMSVIGGMQSPIGTFFGAFLVNALPEAVRFVQNYMKLVYGALIIILMIFMPTGIGGVVSEKFKAYMLKKKKAKSSQEGQ